MMVRLHLNSQKDLLCHQLYLQRAALEDELEYEMFGVTEDSTVIQLKALPIAHQKAFWTPKIHVT
jgi:hypothetical protein